jgi:hypothetical protein
MRSIPRTIVSAVILLPLAAPEAAAVGDPCGEWAAGEFPIPGVFQGTAAALAVHDDGSGPVLYVGGDFTAVGTAMANDVARWDGNRFTSLGRGPGTFSGGVLALAFFDDGSGTALYAGGSFNSVSGASPQRLARWNGNSWSPIGQPDGVVRALVVHDDGSGPALYAGGDFTMIGGVAASGIARWDGVAWSPVAGGVSGGGVSALRVHDDGRGIALFAGGSFTATGDGPVNRVARLAGGHWHPVGVGMSDAISAFESFDDGSGPALYAGGSFGFADLQQVDGIARWNGSGWSPVGSTGSRPGTFQCLAVFDDGSGPRLHAGGLGQPAGAGVSITSWDGVQWTSDGESPRGSVRALVPFDVGPRHVLVAAGAFEGTLSLPHGMRGLAAWDGASWSALSAGIDQQISALRTFDDGNGPALYVGGEFVRGPDGSVVNHVARVDGNGWSPLGSGTNGPVTAFAVWDDGSGPQLYVAGSFTQAGGLAAPSVARWNGSAWSPVGSGSTNGFVSTLRVFDDGSGQQLYAGGNFNLIGNVAANDIARWNGFAWAPVGGGIGGGPNDVVLALTGFAGGGRRDLYAGGVFLTAGGANVRSLARWNGTSWSDVQGGVTLSGTAGAVRSLAVFDDGGGLALFVGGHFSSAGSVASTNLARWSGTAWTDAGIAGSTEVFAIGTFDDGTGLALVSAANGVVRRRAAGQWDPLGSGMEYTVTSLAAFDDGSGSCLFAGGLFGTADGAPSAYLARWRPSNHAGNVARGAGRVEDSLFVNGSAGDAAGDLHASLGQPVTVHLAASSVGPATTSYALWAWRGPSVRPSTLAIGGTRIGCSANPTPFAAPATPRPFRCHRGGLDASFSAGVPSVFTTPPSAPWTLTRAAGFSRPLVITLQAVIADDGAANSSRLSLTNAVFLRIP